MNIDNSSYSSQSHHAKWLGLGIDAGGTQTRWAIADQNQQIVANGTAAGISANRLSEPGGSEEFFELFSALAATASSHGIVKQVRAGITGYGGEGYGLPLMLSRVFDVPLQAILLSNDIEIAYQDIFKPGEGYLIYAGTGSIAAYIDQQGDFHRAGGRGVLLDDAGGGYWIAREALRYIWRNEDEQPGFSEQSIMAKRIGQMIGGSDWNAVRQFVYQQNRGEIGKLALAVASAANQDPVALDILQQAGRELARIGLALVQRYGLRPIAIGGRVQDLHPAIVESIRNSLPEAVSLRQTTCRAHFSAARLAARLLSTIPQ